MVPKLFQKLYKNHIIRTESFILWKCENETKQILYGLSYFFQQITENKKNNYKKKSSNPKNRKGD